MRQIGAAAYMFMADNNNLIPTGSPAKTFRVSGTFDFPIIITNYDQS